MAKTTSTKKNRTARQDARAEQGQVSVERRRSSLDQARDELGSQPGLSGTLAQARARTAEHEAQIRESLEEDGRALVDERGVPVWCVRVHHRIGSIGGFVVWALLAAVVIPAVVSVLWAVLMSVGVHLVSGLAPAVLTEMGGSAELVSSRTDSFLFSWVLPVLFFVLILAGIALWVFRLVAEAMIEWGRRLALGLFAGYGHGPIADWRILRARRAVVGAKRAADRRVTQSRLAESISAEQSQSARHQDH